MQQSPTPLRARPPVHAVPHTRSASSPLPATAPPPPTPLNTPCHTAAFDPLGLVASSSSQVPGLGSASGGCKLKTAEPVSGSQVYPRSVDFHVDIRIWPRAQQLGDEGNLLPFFGLPPANPAQQQDPPPGAFPQPPPPPPAGGPGQPSSHGPAPPGDFPHLLQLTALLAAAKHALLASSTPTSATPMPPTPPPPQALALHAATPTPAVEDHPSASPPWHPLLLSRSSASVALCAQGATDRRRPRVGLLLSTEKPKRQSSRLAAKAVQLKALQNALLPCSSSLRATVKKKGMMNHSKLPISVADLRKMVAAAGLGEAPMDAGAPVPAVVP